MPVTATLRRLRQEDCGAGGQSAVRKGKEREESGRGMGKEEDGGSPQIQSTFYCSWAAPVASLDFSLPLCSLSLTHPVLLTSVASRLWH